MCGSDLTFRLSVLLQLQPTPTQTPVLALKTDEHHVSKRDVLKNQLAPPTNLVRRRRLRQQCVSSSGLLAGSWDLVISL